MGRVVLEDRGVALEYASQIFGNFFEIRIRVGRQIVFLEYLAHIDCLFLADDYRIALLVIDRIAVLVDLLCRSLVCDFACGEIDLTHHCGMDTAEVKHKLAVHIQPHVVVAGEFKDDVVAPVVLAVRRLHKSSLHLHTEEVVGIVFRNAVKLFVTARMAKRERLVIHIFNICVAGDKGRIQGIIGHELAVALARHGGFDGSELLIQGKVAAVLVIGCKVLGRFIFKIAAFVVNFLHEQVVRIDCIAEQRLQGSACCRCNRIAVFIQLR